MINDRKLQFVLFTLILVDSYNCYLIVRKMSGKAFPDISGQGRILFFSKILENQANQIGHHKNLLEY